MTVVQRIIREPALISGLVQAVLALIVAFGLDLTSEQTATILAVTAAVLALLTRSLVTPAGEVVATRRPDRATPQAGQASDLPTGAPVAVVPTD